MITATTTRTDALRVPSTMAEARLVTKRACGTNGWMSSWGTNAHGEIAGCPPPTS